MRVAIALIVLAHTLPAAFAETVYGNGKIETQRRKVSDFSSISFGGSGEIRIHRGPQKLAITTDANIQPYLETRVTGGRLDIGFRTGSSIVRMTKLEIDVTIPSFTGMGISGSANAYIDRFSGEEFESTLSGSGTVSGDLGYSAARFSLSGSGEYRLKGKSESVEIRITGSGRVEGRDFAVDTMSIAVSGSGSAELRVAKRLDVDLSGSGSISYWGDPVISQRISGSARVTRAGR